MKKVLNHLNYQTFLVKSRSWEEIIKFYENRILDNGWNLSPMTDLIKYIAENYSFGIYGTTSMHTLCLAQTEKLSLNENVLKVNFIGDKFEFVYIDPKKRESTGWKKLCNVGEEVATFEHILSRLKWIIR